MFVRSRVKNLEIGVKANSVWLFIGIFDGFLKYTICTSKICINVASLDSKLQKINYYKINPRFHCYH